MIYGFNTDVQEKGVTYHVQTEDRGVKNPTIDTLIYRGGKIIERINSPYDLHLVTPKEIEELVKNQHRTIVDAIRKGKFSAEKKEQDDTAFVPAGYEITLVNADSVSDAGQLSFNFRVWNKLESQSARRTLLELKLLAAGHGEQSQSAWTDEQGTASVHFPIPDGCSEAALLACVSGSAGREVVKYMVRANTTV